MAQYILIDIERGKSILHKGARLFTITWIDAETMEICRTQVDDSMDNYYSSGWKEITDKFNSREFTRDIYTNLKKTRKVDKNQDYVITADSVPRYYGTAEIDLIEQHVQMRLDQWYPLNRPIEIHGGLFVIE